MRTVTLVCEALPPHCAVTPRPASKARRVVIVCCVSWYCFGEARLRFAILSNLRQFGLQAITGRNWETD